jgi:hypothetical protein
MDVVLEEQPESLYTIRLCAHKATKSITCGLLLRPSSKAAMFERISSLRASDIDSIFKKA